jgi:hypothetical protein
MTIHALPQADINTLWERYVGLIHRQNDEPALRTDLSHQTEIARAHKRFCDAINATEEDAA